MLLVLPREPTDRDERRSSGGRGREEEERALEVLSASSPSPSLGACISVASAAAILGVVVPGAESIERLSRRRAADSSEAAAGPAAPSLGWLRRWPRSFSSVASKRPFDAASEGSSPGVRDPRDTRGSCNSRLGAPMLWRASAAVAEARLSFNSTSSVAARERTVDLPGGVADAVSDASLARGGSAVLRLSSAPPDEDPSLLPDAPPPTLPREGFECVRACACLSVSSGSPPSTYRSGRRRRCCCRHTL